MLPGARSSVGSRSRRRSGPARGESRARCGAAPGCCPAWRSPAPGPRRSPTSSRPSSTPAGRLADAEERAVRERAAATARQNRRLRWLLVGTAVLLAVALVAGLLAMRARGEAEESATRAEASATSADARRLAANALNEDRPSLALLQAVEATQREQSPETYGALLTLLTRSPDIVTRFRIAGAPPTDRRERRRSLGLPRREHRHPVRGRRGHRRAAVDRGESRWFHPVGHRGRRPARSTGWRCPLIGDPESMAMAVLDPRTGKVMREVTVEDLTDVEPRGGPLGGRVGPSVRPEGRADDGVARLRDRPRHRRGAAGDAVRAPRAGQLEPAGTAGSRPRRWGQKQTRVLDLRTGRQRLQPGLVVGVDDSRQPDHHVQGDDERRGARRTSSSVMRSGGRSARPSASTGRSWRWRSSPGAARSPSRGRRSWTSTTPRR